MTYKGGEQNILVPPTERSWRLCQGAAPNTYHGEPVFADGDETMGR